MPAINAQSPEGDTQANLSRQPDDVDKKIDKDVFALGFDNAALNRNALSRKVTSDMLNDMDAYAHEVNRVTNDIGDAFPGLLDPNSQGSGDAGQR